MMDGPFRGYVPIADELLAAAREIGRAVIDEAFHRARPGEPIAKPLPTDSVLLSVIKDRGFVELRATRSALWPEINIAARCACGSLASTTIDEFRFLVAADRWAAARVWTDALDELRCCCVKRKQ